MQREYAEAAFLEKARGSSPQLRAYYERYRPSIPWPIHWLVDDGMHPRIHGCTAHQNDECAIILSQFPTTKNAHVLAHELGHLVLDAEGFPLTTPLASSGPLQALSGSLNSALQDPIIEARLGVFGFRTVEKYKRWSLDVREDMVSAHHAFGDQAPFELQTERMLMLVKHRLWWNAIAPGRADIYFWAWLEREFPSLAEAAGILSAVVENLGYSTPDSMSSAINELRRSLNLEGALSEPTTCR